MIDLAAEAIELVLLDIEGTTTPMAFVHDVLFTYARRHLEPWLAENENTPGSSAIADALSKEHAIDAARDETVPAWAGSRPSSGELSAYVRWLMDRDWKSPGLKSLQGLIWEDGYRSGVLQGITYPDVPDGIRRWRRNGVRVAIFSSGSELAQRRLFESLPSGNLAPLIDGFFDTSVGPKGDPASYRRIMSALGHTPERTLFVSDVMAELSAASTAGCRVALSVRPDVSPAPAGVQADLIRTFDEIV